MVNMKKHQDIFSWMQLFPPHQIREIQAGKSCVLCLVTCVF
jgi:hypothetical protein